jgi:hypothetical protein
VVTNARVDDEDLSDFDPAYFPKRVYRDGKGPRVPMMLTDGQPEWMRTLRRPVFDASRHRPGPVNVLSDEAMRDVRLAAMDARQRYIQQLNDAWKTQPGGAGGEPLTTAPSAEPGSDDDDVESARDRYIAGLQNAYKTPMGQAPAASADNIAGLTRSWLSPGARPGPGPGYSDARPAVSRKTGTKDAAADREQAYAGYLDRLANGWRK